MRTANLAFLCLICLMTTLVFADSVQSIPITGTAVQGQPGFNCCFDGDFAISGPGLSLFQGTPDGPSSIGGCRLETVCNFSYSIGTVPQICSNCDWSSSGSLGSASANFLDVSLLFKGSAFYSGATTMTVPMTVSGTIIGYQLVCAPDGTDCTPGPVQFTLHITGRGEGTVTLQETGVIAGTSTGFSGTATVVPEPISLVLTGTGLVGVLMYRIYKNQF